MEPLPHPVESNAFQVALPQALREGMLPIVQVKQHRDKLWRLMELAPHFENGRIRIHRQNHEDLIHEYLQFPKGEHDDILDALHLAFSNAKNPPLVVMDLFPPRATPEMASNFPFGYLPPSFR